MMLMWRAMSCPPFNPIVASILDRPQSTSSWVAHARPIAGSRRAQYAPSVDAGFEKDISATVFPCECAYFVTL
jgi:predicted lipase